jgi:hypothetical protein
MKNMNVATGLVLGMLLVGCGGPQLGPDAPDPTAAPPACSPAEAPFAKVVNPGTSGEYKACTVTIQAEFNSPDWGGMVGGDIEGFVKWSASLPGAAPSAPAGPFGAMAFKMMYVAKTKSDTIFKLKKGDHITVKGLARTNAVGQVTFYAFEIAPNVGK